MLALDSLTPTNLHASCSLIIASFLFTVRLSYLKSATQVKFGEEGKAIQAHSKYGPVLVKVVRLRITLTLIMTIVVTGPIMIFALVKKMVI